MSQPNPTPTPQGLRPSPRRDAQASRDIRQGIDPYRQPSFSRRNRLARGLWGLVDLLLFRPSPPPLHAWRAILLRLFGAQMGRHCHVYGSARIWAPWNLTMAAESCLGPRVICYNMAPVHLGTRAIISQGVHLCTGSHDYTSSSFQLFSKPITVGANAWVCADAFLAPGVAVGEGCVIGARSVVTRDQPAWMVCAGNPCHPRKERPQPKS